MNEPLLPSTWKSIAKLRDRSRHSRILCNGRNHWQRTRPLPNNNAILRAALADLAVSYMSLLLLALILSAIIFRKQARWRRLRWLAAFVLFGSAYNAASCLEVAIVNSLEVHRYITVQMYATLLTQFLAFWLILEFALDITQRRDTIARDLVAPS